MKRLLALSVLICSSQAFAAEVVPCAENVTAQESQVAKQNQVTEAQVQDEIDYGPKLEELLVFIANSSMSDDKKEAIFAAVEGMKKAKASEVVIIKFINEFINEVVPAKTSYSKFKIALIVAVIAVMIVVGGYTLIKLITKNKTASPQPDQTPTTPVAPQSVTPVAQKKNILVCSNCCSIRDGKDSYDLVTGLINSIIQNANSYFEFVKCAQDSECTQQKIQENDAVLCPFLVSGSRIDMSDTSNVREVNVLCTSTSVPLANIVIRYGENAGLATLPENSNKVVVQSFQCLLPETAGNLCFKNDGPFKAQQEGLRGWLQTIIAKK